MLHRLARTLTALLIVFFLTEHRISAHDATPASLVRITASNQSGTGIVVGVERDLATIITAAHVIAGNPNFSVVFATAPDRAPLRVGLGDVVGMDAADTRNGLA